MNSNLYIYFLYLACCVIIYESFKWFYNDIYEAHFAVKRDTFVHYTCAKFENSKNKNNNNNNSNNSDREYIDVDGDDNNEEDENIKQILIAVTNQLKKSLDQSQTQAVYYISTAINFDKEKRYSNALDNYTQGIGILIPLAKNDINLKVYLEYYISRAEHLKSECQKSKPNITPLLNYFPKLKTQKNQLTTLSTSINDTISSLSLAMRNRNSPIVSTNNNYNNNNSLNSLNNNYLKTSNGLRNPSSFNNNNINRYSPKRTLSSSTLSKAGIIQSTASTASMTSSIGNTPTRSQSINGGSVNNNNNNNNNIIPDIKGVDPTMIATIMNEILDTKEPVTWDSVIGLEKVKQTLNETVILPNLRPDIFTGLRAPPKGLLLYGPPGNGKTMIAKAVAYESKLKFFSISASSLTSKYVGDGEKLVRALFAVARHLQPSIIFIDEIDSLLTSRNSNDSESSRRIKTEILVQFDGVRSSNQDRVLVMGATNRPGDLDDAALRRMIKRIYVGLPEKEARKRIITGYLSGITHSLTDKQIDQLGDKTEGFSAFDIHGLVKDASYQPIRALGLNVKDFNGEIKPTSNKDFMASFKEIRPSVDKSSLKYYEDWTLKFGTL